MVARTDENIEVHLRPQIRFVRYHLFAEGTINAKIPLFHLGNVQFDY